MGNAFSVLMSVYYKEDPSNLELAFRSILIEQTQIPNEFILVCDGALNEKLDAVIEKYEKKFSNILKVYRQKNNQGLGKALNFGLTKCRYELIARADSDDICQKNRFEIQLIFMLQHPEISIISSYIDEFNTDYTKPQNIKKLPLKHAELVNMAKFRNPLNHMAVMFRKRDIIEIGSYHNLPYVEDYELWVRAIINGKKLANIDSVLVHARVGNCMIKRRGNREYIKSWKVLSSYMLHNGMINRFEYYRNMIAVRGFIYMSVGLKEIVYKLILRKE
ncbi:glycosyltransferase [Anaerorhabdus furcosa]|uniref:Glycosyl transferase family 2 n=1 Tax=Anaerorhabdus furcosa TaxID=118967 RepID=A0A1T4NDR2_9FIRM|nr:glycosyltransferase [Anaerorhabdus furcosa]SJZ77273.1 Glycosyl transferase family 2 [Anaerorhabdus furcosa]